MFGGRCDLAILSGPLALQRAKRFWWFGYAIAAIAIWVFCFGQPELSGGASSWRKHLLNPSSGVWGSAPGAMMTDSKPMAARRSSEDKTTREIPCDTGREIDCHLCE
ncbi:MAG: hypothetical protein GDA36_03365 [Rhodobacteraceae bacterium]|nr:hypothetical protein [Paracoccaceae bacterium]